MLEVIAAFLSVPGTLAVAVTILEAVRKRKGKVQ